MCVCELEQGIATGKEWKLGGVEGELKVSQTLIIDDRNYRRNKYFIMDTSKLGQKL